MDKRLVIYLSATFGLSWVVWAVAGVVCSRAPCAGGWSRVLPRVSRFV